MDKIAIQPTPTTPRIFFDAETGYLEISGKSLPENSVDFFMPVQTWLDHYLSNPGSITRLTFKLEYFNTSSTSQFLKMIKKIEKLHERGLNAAVNWYYDHEDEDMREAGEDFKLLVKIPVEIIGTDFIGL
jgi:SiaC family regulatory phosphoprotein